MPTGNNKKPGPRSAPNRLMGHHAKRSRYQMREPPMKLGRRPGRLGSILRGIFLSIIGVLLGIAIISLAVGIYALHYYGRGLPDYRQLADYEPSTATRLYAANGQLIAEYAAEKRLFVPIEAIPQHVIRAFLAAEDKNFYDHPGIDFLSIVRAIFNNVNNVNKGRRLQGGSTITQQVAKNFLLSNERSIERKIREAMLAFRIERAFSKGRILELYLNEIYLGAGSYGVAAAALNYFSKSLDELTIAEAAFLAALPKAPNNYHPVRRLEAAIERRNWVVSRLLNEGYIKPREAAVAQNEPIITSLNRRAVGNIPQADWFAEEVRRSLVDRYGEDDVIRSGLAVRSTLNPHLQDIAQRTLREGLVVYDRRHGWRGPIAHFDSLDNWRQRLGEVVWPQSLLPWKLALVLEIDAQQAKIGFTDGTYGSIPFKEMKWARPWRPKQRVGPSPRRPADVLKVGDIVTIKELKQDTQDEDSSPQKKLFSLQQIPDVQGAIVVLDPHSGRVLAMVGGLSFDLSMFNRATQAYRQPGSAFKPFVYLAALDNGYTPASLILDAPFVLDQGPDRPAWRPVNYSDRFYGPTTMRIGIEKSRNLMTVRLAQAVKMTTIAELSVRFGIVDSMPLYLPVALGASETTLLRLTAAYAMIVNGGKRIAPSLVERIQDRHGQTIYRHDHRVCRACSANFFPNQSIPVVEDDRVSLIHPHIAYQMVSMLEGVVRRGTGARIGAALKNPLAGKTGTSNESRDTWFVGFSPDLAVGIYVGFDQPRSLGPKESGSRVTAPIFLNFMREALKDKLPVPFRMPNGMRLVYVNRATGVRTHPSDPNSLLEAFRPGTEPSETVQVVDGGLGLDPRMADFSSSSWSREWMIVGGEDQIPRWGPEFAPKTDRFVPSDNQRGLDRLGISTRISNSRTLPAWALPSPLSRSPETTVPSNSSDPIVPLSSPPLSFRPASNINDIFGNTILQQPVAPAPIVYPPSNKGPGEGSGGLY